MKQAWFTFHAELNVFLPKEERGSALVRPFRGRVSVKHLIEAIGIPHTEIEVILANGRSVGFVYQVRDKDAIDVYPASVTVHVSPLADLRPPLPNPHRFILDNHLGRLACYLRLLGFDTLYPNSYDDPKLAKIAHDEARILLTRDRGLLKRRIVTYGQCLNTRDSKKQLKAVLDRFDLHQKIRPWQRCLRCNDQLHPIEKDRILHRLEPKTKLYYDEFHICQTCDHIYWKGSHFSHMQEFLDNLRTQDSGGAMSPAG